MEQLPQFFNDHAWTLAFVALWTLPWKGVALWRAAHRNEKKWFIALFILNTLALLEIYYLLVWTKRKQEEGNGVFKRI